MHCQYRPCDAAGTPDYWWADDHRVDAPLCPGPHEILSIDSGAGMGRAGERIVFRIAGLVPVAVGLDGKYVGSAGENETLSRPLQRIEKHPDHGKFCRNIDTRRKYNRIELGQQWQD